MSELKDRELNVIYVDDDENDVMLLRYALNQAGVELPMQHLPDGEVAMKYLRGDGKYHNRAKYPMPDLLLLDIKMPGMDGLSLLKWIRSQPELCGLVVIMFSSSDEESDVRRAYERGANSYIVKSADFQAQVRMARAFQAWWLEVNHHPRSSRASREREQRLAQRKGPKLRDDKLLRMA
jgi:CheY-like chemotaxis protein